LGDLLVLDVGGATTDVHSVTPGSGEIGVMLISPEPFAKRTVEGDLGVYVNIRNVAEIMGMDALRRQFPDADTLLNEVGHLPINDKQKAFITCLTQAAIICAMERHAGKLIDSYGPMGRKTLAAGKDLTAIRYVIGTGGALTRLPSGAAMLENILEKADSTRLWPRKGARVLIDRHYIMASLGVMAARYPQDALLLLRRSLSA
jgi:uncharacterized protein (TIGR01319 family)